MDQRSRACQLASLSDRSCIELIEGICFLEIEPWLLLVLDEQAVLDELSWRMITPAPRKGCFESE
ncbi:MAG: hypothetical protein VCA12_11790 [Pseudomonadales bacterium]